MKYIPPVLGLTAGIVIGDFIGLGGAVLNLITRGQSAGVDSKQAALGMTAGIYAVIGVVAWKGLGGWLGMLIGGFFCGIAIRLALKLGGVM